VSPLTDGQDGGEEKGPVSKTRVPTYNHADFLALFLILHWEKENGGRGHLERGERGVPVILKGRPQLTTVKNRVTAPGKRAREIKTA